MPWWCLLLLLPLLYACSERSEAPEVPPEEPIDLPAEPRVRMIDIATRAQDQWDQQAELPPTQAPEDVAASLERAAELLESGELIEPADENALTHFLSVLEAYPDNAEARQGINAVVAALIERADKALDENNEQQALDLLPVLLRLRPEDEAVLALRERVQRVRARNDLLTAAGKAIEAGQLTRPIDDSAVSYYRAVLELDPDNAEAQQGLGSVANLLIEQAMAAGREMRFPAADRLLNQAAGIRPGSQSLLDARSRLFEFREQRMSQTQQDIDQALAASELDRVEQLLAMARDSFPDMDGLAAREERLVSARIYASRSPGDVFTDPFQDSSGESPALVVMPLSQFRMGSPDDETDRVSNEGPVRVIRFARAFALGQAEVTVAEFRVFIEASGYRTDAERNGNSSVYDEQSGRIVRRARINWTHDYAGDRANDNYPVLHVSWNDSQAYLQWLSERTGQAYRLPSEAEFEFALRAGSTTRYWWGDGMPDRVVANVTGDGERSRSRRSWTHAFRNYNDGHWGPAPVRIFPVNPFGLYDIDGNVSEWVEDCWHDSYRRGPTDGRAWVNPGCNRRVVRGASWGSSPDQVRSAFRLNATPDTRGSRVGFRIARDL